MFHEDEGGHFGVDDDPGRTSHGIPTFVMEYCSKAKGRIAVGSALFVALSRGGTFQPMKDTRAGGDGKIKDVGFLCKLDDGTVISWRWISGTEASPALEIRNTPDPRVMRHKIHFFEEESRHRK